MSLCDASLEALVRALNQHHTVVAALVEKIEQQSEHIGMLVQSVVLLLGEEVGVPLPDGDAAAEPQRTDMDGNPSIRSAILLTMGHLYANRSDVVVGAQVMELPQGARSLLRPYRRVMMP